MGNALNLKEINQEETLNLLRFTMKTGSNLFLFGRRGLGKTHLSLQAARECGYKISYINLSVIERPDLAGWPILNDASDVVVYKQPYYLPKLETGARSDQILLFDEADKCHSEITAPLLEILQFRTINGKQINAAACILTGNLMSENAGSNQISPALLDRGAKYVLGFSFPLWLKWARENNLNELVLGFLIRNPELAIGEIETEYYATPSPRGWTLVSEALNKAVALNLDDIDTMTSIVAGFVGAECSLKFFVWLKYYKQYEPIIHTLLERGVCSVNFSELDQTEKYVFSLTACHLAKLKILDPPKGRSKTKCLEYLCAFFDREKVENEIQLIALRNSFPMEAVVKNKALLNCKPFFEKISGFTDMLG